MCLQAGLWPRMAILITYLSLVALRACALKFASVAHGGIRYALVEYIPCRCSNRQDCWISMVLYRHSLQFPRMLSKVIIWYTKPHAYGIQNQLMVAAHGPPWLVAPGKGARGVAWVMAGLGGVRPLTGSAPLRDSNGCGQAS